MNQTPASSASNKSGASTLRFDIVSGLTASAVVLPKAMAYATVAGLSVAVGLYTCFIPMVIYALLGSSRVLSVSSTTTLGILTGAELGTVVPDGDPMKLCPRIAGEQGLEHVRGLAQRLEGDNAGLGAERPGRKAELSLIRPNVDQRRRRTMPDDWEMFDRRAHAVAHHGPRE
jgi:hypothetical protein